MLLLGKIARLANLALPFWMVLALYLDARLAGAATLHVPGDFPTIQLAADAAGHGDTVLVAPGTYVERIVINHDLWLISEDGPLVTTIDAAEQGTVITLNTQSAGIRGFRITHGRTGNLTAGGIHVVGFGDGSFVVQNNIIEHNRGLGFVGGVYSARMATIEDNLFQDNAGPKGTSAIQAWGVIRRNIIRNNGQDLVTAWVSGTIEENVIVDNLGSAALFASGTIRNNTVANNWCGQPVVQIEGDDIEFANNVITHVGPDGLWCGFSGAAQVVCNNVWGMPGVPYTGDCADEAGVHGNFSADPLFCDPANGDYRLQPDSPCAPENSLGCGLIGALPVCSATALPGEAPPAALTFGVEPNPARGAVEFTLTPGINPASIEIYDSLGRLVETLHPTSSRIRWAPASSPARGVYFARLTSHGENSVVKFIFLP